MGGREKAMLAINQVFASSSMVPSLFRFDLPVAYTSPAESTFRAHGHTEFAELILFAHITPPVEFNRAKYILKDVESVKEKESRVTVPVK